VNFLLATLFLLPPTHELAAPGTFQIPVAETKPRHLRWKSAAKEGYWNPPNLTLPLPGQYWVSAATPAKLRTMQAAEFSRYLKQEGLTFVEDYRRKYKLLQQPAKVIQSEYAKTLVSIGPIQTLSLISLNLPVEFVLRYATLLQLNFRGQPIPDVQVTLNGQVLGRTNGAGQIPLPELTAPARLSATVARAYADPTTASWEFFTATLTLPALGKR
jgi:hypothetical protein